MDFLKFALLVSFNLALVITHNCFPISDSKEVIEYLQNFGYLTEDDKIFINQIGDAKEDKRLERALKNLQKNGNIPVTGKYDERTSALIQAPRCGVPDQVLNTKQNKQYAFMSTKWQTTNLTYRFDFINNEKFVKEGANIRRIIREAFNVWERDTVLKFTESNDEIADIVISFQNPKHIKIDPVIFSNQALGHAFQPGMDLGGDVHINEQLGWDFNVSYDRKPANGKISFYAAMLHLIGHSLGLNHTLDAEAVMYEFYPKRTSTLTEDDIREIHSIYGVPPNRKYIPLAKPQDSGEDRLIWDLTPRLPDKCNTSYDAIALINGEIIAFKGKFMFSSRMDVVEIRSRWRQLPHRMTHVDAVYQATDGKVLFFIGQAVYSFIGTQLDKMFKLDDLGIDSRILKIDAIFRRLDSQQTYIFIGDYYNRFDEHKMMVIGKSIRISKAFKDVYGMDTAFTYKDITYFFKNEYYFEFMNSNWVLQRMAPDLSANFFMNCSVEVPSNRVVDTSFKANSRRDYIDTGLDFYTFEPDCENPEIELC
ncbi:hypothetical protein ACKWTF_013617 [Chironomus riparius]